MLSAVSGEGAQDRWVTCPFREPYKRPVACLLLDLLASSSQVGPNCPDAMGEVPLGIILPGETSSCCNGLSCKNDELKHCDSQKLRRRILC